MEEGFICFCTFRLLKEKGKLEENRKKWEDRKERKKRKKESKKEREREKERKKERKKEKFARGTSCKSASAAEMVREKKKRGCFC